MQSVFSRSGFTDGYYSQKLGRDMFGVRTKDDVIAAGDTYAYLHELYRAERQSVQIKMSAEIKTDSPITLNVSDGENSVTVKGDIPSLAKNKPLEEQAVCDSLTKLGNTPYFCRDINLNLDDELFVPSSALNALRRDAVNELDGKRAVLGHQKSFAEPQFVKSASLSGKKQLFARFASKEQIPQNLDGIKAVIIPFECDMPRNFGNIEIIAELPRYIVNETAVKKRLDELKQQGINSALCANLSAVALAKSASFKVIGGIGLNIDNNESINVYKNLGADSLMLSAEISLKEIKNINADINIGIFAYGRLPLMLTRNCPLKNGRTCAECDKKGFLTDRKNLKFPIMCRAGYSEMLNSAPLYMGDRLDEITDVDFLTLYFTTETSEECGNVINKYIHGERPDGEYTRNLYYRDLI